MQANPKSSDTVMDDSRYEVAVMSFVVNMHPIQMRDSELILGMTQDWKEPDRRENLERAMGSLMGAGLLYRNGAVILPTVAALHFHGLPW